MKLYKAECRHVQMDGRPDLHAHQAAVLQGACCWGSLSNCSTCNVLPEPHVCYGSAGVLWSMLDPPQTC